MHLGWDRHSRPAHPDERGYCYKRIRSTGGKLLPECSKLFVLKSNNMKIIIDSYNAGYEDAKCNHINDALNFAQMFLYSKGIEHYPVLISDIRGMRITSLEWLGHKINKYKVIDACMVEINSRKTHTSTRDIIDMVISIIEQQQGSEENPL